MKNNYYKEVLEKLREKVKEKNYPKSGKIVLFCVSSLCEAVLGQKILSTLEHPSCSPDLSPCIFFFFSVLKTIQF